VRLGAGNVDGVVGFVKSELVFALCVSGYSVCTWEAVKATKMFSGVLIKISFVRDER
jgi:hypothetical protein